MLQAKFPLRFLFGEVVDHSRHGGGAVWGTLMGLWVLCCGRLYAMEAQARSLVHAETPSS